MHAILERIRKSATFRPAVAAPIAIMIIFSLFNLTAPPDPSRVPAAIHVGVVNHDQGVPLVPVKVSERLLEGMGQNLPFGLVTLADEDAARAALDRGEVSAVLVLPGDFTLKAMGQDPVAVKVINTQHLSVAETQLANALPQQLQLAFSAAIASARLALARGGLPAPPAAGEGAPALQLPVAVETETLHVARGPASLAAPFVMTFATWAASFVGGLMLYIATRGERAPGSTVPVAAIRTILPVIITGIAALSLATIVAWSTGQWSSFIALWLLVWLATVAISWLIGGLFAVFGFWAVIVVLPAVFYQSALAGAQTPLAAAPDWLRWVGERLPFRDLAESYRSVLIGGPEGSVHVAMLLAVAVIGLALIWLGTWLYRDLFRGRPAAVTGA